MHMHRLRWVLFAESLVRDPIQQISPPWDYRLLPRWFRRAFAFFSVEGRLVGLKS